MTRALSLTLALDIGTSSAKVALFDARGRRRLLLREGLTLREAAMKLGCVTAEQFDAWVRPEEMTRTGSTAGS